MDSSSVESPMNVASGPSVMRPRAFHRDRCVIDTAAIRILHNLCRNMTWARFHFQGDVPGAEMEAVMAQIHGPRLRQRLAHSIWSVVSITSPLSIPNA